MIYFVKLYFHCIKAETLYYTESGLCVLWMPKMLHHVKFRSNLFTKIRCKNQTRFIKMLVS